MPSAAPMRGRQAHSSTTPTIAGMRIAMKPSTGASRRGSPSPGSPAATAAGRPRRCPSTARRPTARTALRRRRDRPIGFWPCARVQPVSAYRSLLRIGGTSSIGSDHSATSRPGRSVPARADQGRTAHHTHDSSATPTTIVMPAHGTGNQEPTTRTVDSSQPFGLNAYSLEQLASAIRSVASVPRVAAAGQVGKHARADATESQAAGHPVEARQRTLGAPTGNGAAIARQRSARSRSSSTSRSPRRARQAARSTTGVTSPSSGSTTGGMGPRSSMRPATSWASCAVDANCPVVSWMPFRTARTSRATASRTSVGWSASSIESAAACEQVGVQAGQGDPERRRRHLAAQPHEVAEQEPARGFEPLDLVAEGTTRPGRRGPATHRRGSDTRPGCR